MHATVFYIRPLKTQWRYEADCSSDFDIWRYYQRSKSSGAQVQRTVFLVSDLHIFSSPGSLRLSCIATCQQKLL